MSNLNPTENSRRQRREQAAADALRSLIRDLLTDDFPGLEHESVEFPLNLSLHYESGESGELTFAPALRTQLREQIEDILVPQETFQSGTVYDFHDHKGVRPPDALAVFAGYDPMGHPKWLPVTELLGKKQSVQIFKGKELKQEQLQKYGKNSKAYNLLGQLILGPLPVPAAYQSLCQNDKWALTVQMVESRSSRNQFSLKLNLLTGHILPLELGEMMEELPLRPLHEAVMHLENELIQLEQQALSAWRQQDSRMLNTTLKHVPRLLTEFSHHISSVI